MLGESIEKNKSKEIPVDDREANILRGNQLLEEGDLSGAYQAFLKEEDIEGLYKVATALSKKGEEEEAADILAKAHELSKLDK